MSVNEKMTALADAIREKSGVTGKLTIDGMTSAVKAISSLIVASASGNPIVLNDSTDLRVQSLRLFGKTTQNGTPTPEAPVPLVSAGDGGDIRTLILPAVNSLEDDTLCGIPVTSGGNYTDETGQQWVCDEVDFGRGIYVQRIFGTVFKSAVGWNIAGTKNGLKRFYTNQFMGVIKNAKDEATKECALCSHFINVTASDTWNEVTGISVNSKGRLDIYYSGIEQTTAALDVYFSSNPVAFMAELATPIETPLSTEELAAYAEKYGANTVAYGKTIQNGTPAPDAPVPLLNSTDIVQAVLASSPNGLPGIPVTSGGNYTDETGQQWVCDEVDFGRGVYVQRIYKYNFTGNEVLISYDSGKSNGRNFEALGLPFIKIQTEGSANNKSNAMCNVTTVGTQATANNGTAGLGFSSWGGIPTFYLSTAILGNGETLKAAMKTAYDNGNPYSMIYELATPNEIALSAEELAAYAALHTNYPNTTILNDGGAGMEVKYVADTKNYIDNQIAAVAAAIVNA